MKTTAVKSLAPAPMSLAQFRAHLAAKVEAMGREALRNDDHALAEGAGEVQSVIDYIDGKNPHHASLQDACDWVAEPNLCADMSPVSADYSTLTGMWFVYNATGVIVKIFPLESQALEYIRAGGAA